VQAVDSRTYDVRGRVKMLVFWTGARSQGTARIIRSAAGDNTRRRELLIGTDPERAFRKMNRWSYGATNYRLRLTSVTNRREITVGGVRYADPVETEFEILNLATRETTEFDMVAGTTGDLTGVPLQITCRPRWWLQIELALAETR
jgi:hypothetical protein